MTAAFVYLAEPAHVQIIVLLNAVIFFLFWLAVLYPARITRHRPDLSRSC